MNRLELPRPVLDTIRTAALESYPEECCGLLLSEADGVSAPGIPRRVVAAEPSPNLYDGERRRRFVIPASELRAAEERADRQGRVISGFYHSHPDHPARPSEFDREHAWPWYAYLVIAVRGDGSAGPVGVFELDAERREFLEVPLTVVPPEEPARGSPAKYGQRA